MEEKEFQALLQEKTSDVEEIIKQYLPKEDGYQKTVLEAMNYSLLAGGKRLRPLLMQEIFTTFGGRGRVVEPFMAAIEMIHTYSLVHDDLPAMDNDEYRRGRRTTWSVYGDAMGILAGDGLLNLAFETALQAFPLKEDLTELEDEQRIHLVAGRMQAAARALHVLAAKAGVGGMIGGQTADIEAEKKEDDSGEQISMEQLLFIHEHKTAALIQAAMMAGAILAGATEREVAAMEKCAYNIGIAFQIQDDILDVIGDSEELGKPVGSDMQNHKQTYVTLKGLEEAKADVKRLSEEAVDILRRTAGENLFLEQLILSLTNRRK
ncbi:MAG: polyprenyl synthetase family protein [Lachnospiraceae bacterium]|nr:polyprenyl synthetase family protein [Lachnospiraceae bacterium]